ncbi:MAG TPA: hypothetical protein VHX62_16585 [Solirubrobacteraceae bacterium]|jgi:hypothetical protein|nr:hypothetical protein [Solirubrobacteraceae bacterium]
MSNTNDHNTLNTAEVEYLNELEAWGGSRSRTRLLTEAAGRADAASGDVDVIAPAQVRAPALAPPRREALEAPMANVWERARREFGGDDVTAVDIRITVHKRRAPAELEREPWPSQWPPAQSDAGKLLAQLRWLLTQSSGTIADVAHQLETRSTDIDDDGREQLLDDVVLLEEELATVKALLVAPVDWDAEHGRLLAGEIPPFDDTADDDEDDA